MFNKASDTLSDYYYFQADIKGNSSVPDMSGTARFYPWLDGTMVEIELTGMPTRNEPFAVHIHEGAVCEPEAFTSAGMHLKSTDVELEVSPERHETNIKSTQNHPGHMGDLPSIFSNNGYAYMATYTDRFIPRQVEGRTVIVHSSPTLSLQPIHSAAASPAELYAEWKSANHFNFLRSFALISVRLILPLTVLGRESTNSMTLGYL